MSIRARAGAASRCESALDWDRRSDERFVGLGRAPRHPARPGRARRAARRRPPLHGPGLPGRDARGRRHPAGRLRAGAVGASRAAATAVWVRTRRRTGRGSTSSGERVSVSTRVLAGPLRLRAACARRRPAARLRALCRLTGFPALLPEWGYGFWKSRDVYEHQDDVLEDFEGFRRTTSRSTRSCSTRRGRRSTTRGSSTRTSSPTRPEMIRRMRADGVRTVVWVTPWVNLDSRDGQIPPQPESERLHREPAPNYAPGAAGGHFVQAASDGGAVRRAVVDGDRLAGRLHQPRRRAVVARAGSSALLALGVEGIKVDDGEGYYMPDDVRFADGRTRRAGGVGARRPAPPVACSERSTRSTRVRACCSGAAAGPASTPSGTPGPAIRRRTSGRCACSWSRRCRRPAAASRTGRTTSAATSGHRLVERCPPELLVRWLQFGCFTPLMHAHARMPQEPWHYGERVLELYRAYVLLHEQLVPYVRAAAATAARTGLPIVRPLCLIDPERPARLDDHRRLRLRAGAVGRAGARGRARASARWRCRGGSGSRRGRAGGARRRRGRRAGAA